MGLPSIVVHIRHSIPDYLVRVADKQLPLSPTGLAFAEKIAEKLYERCGAFSVYMHSEYVRSEQTLKALLKPLSRDERQRAQMVKTELLNERSQGTAFGLSIAEARKRFPDFAQELSEIGEVRACYPNGESMLATIERIKKLRHILLPKFAGRSVCLVGHWGTYFALRYIVEVLDEKELLDLMEYEKPDPCSLMILKPKRGVPSFAIKEKNLMLCQLPR